MKLNIRELDLIVRSLNEHVETMEKCDNRDNAGHSGFEQEIFDTRSLIQKVADQREEEMCNMNRGYDPSIRR